MVVASSLCSLSALAAPEGTLSVHILNQQTGLPSSGVKVVLDKQEGVSWEHIADGKTDADGRIKSLYPVGSDMTLGICIVKVETGDYFKAREWLHFSRHSGDFQRF